MVRDAMLGDVWRKTLRDQRRALVGWTAGLGLLALYIMLLFPTVRSNAKSLNHLMDQLPAATRDLFRGSGVDFSTPEGYLQTELFYLMVPVLFLALGIAWGSRAVAGEEERGTLELLLSLPLRRRRLVLEKLVAMVAATALLGVAFWALLAISEQFVGVHLAPLRLLGAVGSAALLGLVFGALALAMGCVRGRRGLAIAVPAVYAVAAYLVNALAAQVGALVPLRYLSPFYWYTSVDPLTRGVDVSHLGVLLAMVAAFVTAGVWAFDRRDVGV